MLPISVCMIVKDEADILAEALTSVVGRVAEVIVGDTGSTDDSRAIAARLGARVVDVPWADDFAAARNAVAAHATQPWIMRLDADELVLPATLDWLEDALAGMAPAIYLGTRQNTVTGARAAIGTLYPHRPGVGFVGRIHEEVRAADGGLRTSLAPEIRLDLIDHRRPPAREAAKFARYVDLCARELAAGWDARMFFHYLEALAMAGRLDEVAPAYQREAGRLAGAGTWGRESALTTAKALLRLRQHAAAAAHCEQALVTWPDMMPLRICLGLAVEAEARWDEALAAFADTLAEWDAGRPEQHWQRHLYPEVEAQAVRHLLYLAPGRVPPQDLRGLLRPCLEEGERRLWEVHLRLCDGRVNEALDLFLTVGKLSPQALRSWQTLALTAPDPFKQAMLTAKIYGAMAGGQFVTLGLQAARSVEPPPAGRSEWHEVMGRLLARQGDHHEAVRHFAAWAGLEPDSMVPPALQAQALAAAGEAQAARDLIESLLASHPDHPWLLGQRERLAPATATP